MRCLTASECLEWLGANGFEVSSELHPPIVPGGREICFQVPAEARTQRLLSRDLCGWLGAYDTALFWLADWRFAKPDELAVAAGLRGAHGERRGLGDAPGQLFELSEKDALTAWLGLTMSFGWEASLCACPRRHDLLRITREEFILVSAFDSDRMTEAREFARRYDLDIYREAHV